MLIISFTKMCYIRVLAQPGSNWGLGMALVQTPFAVEHLLSVVSTHYVPGRL